MILLNQVFPCFHCFSKTTPAHLYKVFHLFSFCGMGKWNVTKLSHVPLLSKGSMEKNTLI